MASQAIFTENAPKAIGPYSQGMKTGQFVFTSGQLAMDAQTGELYNGGDIQEETKIALSNLKAVLEAGGATLNDVVKVTVFIKDMNQFGLINEVYGKFFVENKPARSCIEVARLPKDGNIEIEAIAVV